MEANPALVRELADVLFVTLVCSILAWILG